MSQRKVQIPSELTSGQYTTQEETLAISRKPGKLYIGIPKENSYQENRIALVPSAVATLVGYGHRIVVESEAGEKSNYTNHDYSEAGAEVAYSKKEIFKADVILKVAPPTPEEVDLLRPYQIIISPIHLPMLTESYIRKLRSKKVTALAWEYIKDDSGTFPLVRTLSELAGISAMLTAAELLTNDKNGRGILLGGISGIPPAKVVILGAGVVAEYATRAAIGLGAEVRIFDNNVYKMMRLQNLIGRRLFTSAIIPQILEQELYTADVVIGAIHAKTGRTPMIVSEDMVMNMKPGSVIIDVSIDQGGCFETSQITTHDNPIFNKHEVIHYCVPNIASRVSRTASLAVSNILTPLLLQAVTSGGIEGLFNSHNGLRHGIYIYKGALTNKHLGERFNINSTDLDLLFASKY